jgi:hypothetical protein
MDTGSTTNETEPEEIGQDSGRHQDEHQPHFIRDPEARSYGKVEDAGISLAPPDFVTDMHTEAELHKRRVIEKVRAVNPDLKPRNQRRSLSLLESADRTLRVFVTYSKLDQLFFDISPRDIEAWSGEGNTTFALFVAGTSDHVYVVPLDRLVDGLKRFRRDSSPQGGYKLHIDGQRHKLREVPDLSLKPYLNAFSQLVPTSSFTNT